MVYKRTDIYDAKAASISRTRSFNDNISYLVYIIITIDTEIIEWKYRLRLFVRIIYERESCE